MGIGNTTPSAAITAAITGADVATVTGRGTGVDDDALAAKSPPSAARWRSTNPTATMAWTC